MLQFPESYDPKPWRPESCQGPGVTDFLGRAVSPELSVMYPFLSVQCPAGMLLLHG